MSKLSLRDLIESGVHFGHRVSRWNPRMARFIYGKRNLIHIINLKETVKGLTRACHFASKLSSTGHQVVFVGTKRQIREVVQNAAAACSMPYVTERWLGGTLTNFQTIHARLKHLESLEELETSGKMELYSKKMQASLQRELSRIKKNLDGIRELHRLPGALIVVDPNNEKIAVREARKLGIPVAAILDTDCNPDDVDIPIPANDDAIRSVQLILDRVVKAVNEGKANYSERAAMEARAEEEGEQFQLASQLRRAQLQAARGGGRSGGGGGGGGRGRGRGPGGREGRGGPAAKPLGEPAGRPGLEVPADAAEAEDIAPPKPADIAPPKPADVAAPEAAPAAGAEPAAGRNEAPEPTV